MKNIFIVILLFSTYCYGQYIPQSRQDTTYTHGVFIMDSILRMMRDSGLTTYSIGSPYGDSALSSGSAMHYFRNDIKVKMMKIDTVRVELFVTDTFYRPHAPCYSMTGYKIEGHNLSYSDMPEWDDLRFYLNKEKMPLSKGIVIWFVKYLK